MIPEHCRNGPFQNDGNDGSFCERNPILCATAAAVAAGALVVGAVALTAGTGVTGAPALVGATAVFVGSSALEVRHEAIR